MSLSYQEKSSLASLIAVLVVFGVYFSNVMKLMRVDQMYAFSSLALMVVAVIALVVIEVVFQIAVAIGSRGTDTDERDRLIAARAGRNSGIALGAGIITLIMAILASELRGVQGDSFILLSPIVIAQILLMLMVLAQVFEYLSQLYYYRRGL